MLMGSCTHEFCQNCVSSSDLSKGCMACRTMFNETYSLMNQGDLFKLQPNTLDKLTRDATQPNALDKLTRDATTMSRIMTSNEIYSIARDINRCSQDTGLLIAGDTRPSYLSEDSSISEESDIEETQPEGRNLVKLPSFPPRKMLPPKLVSCFDVRCQPHSSPTNDRSDVQEESMNAPNQDANIHWHLILTTSSEEERNHILWFQKCRRHSLSSTFPTTKQPKSPTGTFTNTQPTC